jgi:hypothetical protein
MLYAKKEYQESSRGAKLALPVLSPQQTIPAFAGMAIFSVPRTYLMPSGIIIAKRSSLPPAELQGMDTTPGILR